MGELVTSRLSYDQMERICEVAEEAAKKYVMSKVPGQALANLVITVDLDLTEALNVDIDVEVKLSPLLKSANAEDLASGSVKAAFEAIEKYLRELGWQSVR